MSRKDELEKGTAVGTEAASNIVPNEPSEKKGFLKRHWERQKESQAAQLDNARALQEAKKAGKDVTNPEVNKAVQKEAEEKRNADAIKSAIKPTSTKPKSVKKRDFNADYDNVPTWDEEYNQLKSEGMSDDDIEKALTGTKWDKEGSKYAEWNNSRKAPKEEKPVEEPAVEDNTIKNEVDAQNALLDAGVSPQDVDTPEGAKGEMSRLVERLAETGLFKVGEDGRITFIGMDMEPNKRRKAASILGKAATAISIIGALATGGAIPPMNLTNAFLNEDDTKAYDAKIQQMTNTINQVVGSAVQKEAIKDQTKAQLTLGDIDRQFQERMADKQYAQEYKMAMQNFKNQLEMTNVNFDNQKEMAELLHDLQTSFTGDQMSATVAAAKALKESVSDDEFKRIMKTLANYNASNAGTTPMQQGLKTFQMVGDAVMSPVNAVTNIIK